MPKRVVKNIWLTEFIDEHIAPNLEPLGYRKKRKRFRKDQGTFFEYYSFENHRREDVFFLWIGVEFKDISSHKYSSILTDSQIHWAMPIHRILSNAPRYFSYDLNTNKTDLKDAIVKLVSNASDLLDKDLESIRQEISDPASFFDELKKEIFYELENP